jgi:hypothetical protein
LCSPFSWGKGHDENVRKLLLVWSINFSLSMAN